MARAKTPQGEKLKDIRTDDSRKARAKAARDDRAATPRVQFTDWAAI